MDARAGHLPRGVEPRQAGSAVPVGPDPAALVMGRGNHGDPIRVGIDPTLPASLQGGGKPPGEEVGGHGPHVQHHVVVARLPEHRTETVPGPVPVTFMWSVRWQSSPVSRSTPWIPRATMSRGARDPWGWISSMKARPERVLSTAPSPRTASEMRKAGSSVGKRTVGWNWTNSMLATRAPARNAMATPSPVAMEGFVVCR